MSHDIKIGAVLIRENTVLPLDLAFSTEPCVPGWTVITDFDGYALDRKIRKAGWTFFCLATAIKATVFGIDGQKMARRAIERIVENPKLGPFNALQIEAMAAIGSGRFPTIRYITVSVKPRHIQQSLFLSGNDLPGPDAAKNGIARGASAATHRVVRIEAT